MDYRFPGSSGESIRQISITQFVNQKIRNSLVWMIWGVFTSFIAMYAVFTNHGAAVLAFEHYQAILIAQLVVVFLFTARQWSASLTTLKVMFFVYSFLTGLTMAAISVAFSTTVLVSAFTGAMGFFIAFACIGKMTSRDLSGLTPYLMAAVIGLVIALLVNMFVGLGSFFNTAISMLGVGVFSIFTAVDINRIKRQMYEAASMDSEVVDRLALIGALALYLDFVNIFIYLLRFSRD